MKIKDVVVNNFLYTMEQDSQVITVDNDAVNYLDEYTSRFALKSEIQTYSAGYGLALNESNQFSLNTKFLLS